MKVRKLRFMRALRDGLVEEMRRDPTTIVLGEDVTIGLMGVTTGLVDEFGSDRVFDTPLAELGFTGAAVGAAMDGLRPIVEYQISTLPYLAMDQLVNQAAKLRYMTGGQMSVPLVIRMASSGASGGVAAQHSDHNYPMLAHMGLKVVMPATPADAKGLLKAAIRDNDPVIFYEDAKLMGMRGDVPKQEYIVPLGKAAVPRTGKDVTVVGAGHMVVEALQVAEALAAEGVDVEVVDVRTILPLDTETILESAAKTGRVVVADDSNSFCGFAAEVAAVVADEAFSDLKGPVVRVARPTIPIPFSPPLEEAVLPGGKEIRAAIERLMA